MAKILVVDDEVQIRRSLREILEFENYEVEEAGDGMDAVVKIKKGKFDLLIMDIKMPKMDGMDALERIQILAPDVPVIMISGHADIDTAVETVRRGAFDFLAKPMDLNRILITVRNALDKSSLITETKVLQKKVTHGRNVQEIIGASESIVFVKNSIERVAPTEARVLVTGPNGTGKELVARWIHEKSARREGPIVEVNCAAIPSELIESELFGHEKGAFTTAIKQRIGKFEQANGGTLFLDEIGDMSLSAQAKVLRALQENRITRVGGDKDISVDVRIVAATNKNLREEIDQKRFREDLYHRLAVVVIQVPALNDRKEDIPLLVQHFIQQICESGGKANKPITEEALALLQEQNWTGNIRELRNVVERLIIFSREKITEEDVQVNVLHTAAPPENAIQRFLSQFPTWEAALPALKEVYERLQRQ